MDAKDAYTQMAAIAMSTDRIHVGSGITPIYTRTPVMAGMSMLALAELSKERAILGLGTGHPIGVEGGHGVKLDRPLTAMREYVEIVRLPVREREFRYEGQAYNVPRYAGTSRSYFEDHPFRIPHLRRRTAVAHGQVGWGGGRRGTDEPGDATAYS